MPFKTPLMKKRMTLMVIGLAVVFGGIFAFNLIKSILMGRFFAHYQPPAITVSSVKAVARDWKPRIEAVGNFVAINGVEVNAQVSGTVVAIHVDSGQYLEKGSPLLDIDSRVDEATLKFNQAELSLQEVNYKRQVDLLKRNATATSSVDEARAKLLQAQATLEKTQTLLDQKHIKTPFSGQLGILQINLGQYITPGQTDIVTLQSLDPMFLDFYLPEQRLEDVHLNQAITFSVEQNPSLRFQGTITAINSKIDPNTHTLHVQATLPNCPTDVLQDPLHAKSLTVKKLPYQNTLLITCNSELNTQHHVKRFNFMPGMFASIEMDEPTKQKTIVLPSTAISYTLYGNSVFVIEKDKGGKQTVKRVFVTTGETQGNDTVITKGIKVNDAVVSSGELKLQDGTEVIINNDVQLRDTENLASLGQ